MPPNPDSLESDARDRLAISAKHWRAGCHGTWTSLETSTKPCLFCVSHYRGWMLEIIDMSGFVEQQGENLIDGQLIMPTERVYRPTIDKAFAQIGVE